MGTASCPSFSLATQSQGSNMLFVVVLSLIAVVQSATTSTSKVQLSVAEKLKMTEDIQDADVIKDVEQLIEGLDDATLLKLERILSEELSTEKELDLIKNELAEMGMDVEDIQDLLDLATLMTDFLHKVPEVEQVVVGEDEYSLEDNVKLYLLGLPNKLGPLGFLALHSVLETDESDIVDVKIGSFEPANATSATAPADNASKSGDSAKSGDLVADILARRRRSLPQDWLKQLRIYVGKLVIDKLAKYNGKTLNRKVKYWIS